MHSGALRSLRLESHEVNSPQRLDVIGEKISALLVDGIQYYNQPINHEDQSDEFFSLIFQIADKDGELQLDDEIGEGITIFEALKSLISLDKTSRFMDQDYNDDILHDELYKACRRIARVLCDKDKYLHFKNILQAEIIGIKSAFENQDYSKYAPTAMLALFMPHNTYTMALYSRFIATIGEPQSPEACQQFHKHIERILAGVKENIE